MSLSRFTGIPINPTDFSSKNDNHSIAPHTRHVITPSANSIPMFHLFFPIRLS